MEGGSPLPNHPPLSLRPQLSEPQIPQPLGGAVSMPEVSRPRRLGVQRVPEPRARESCGVERTGEVRGMGD